MGVDGMVRGETGLVRGEGRRGSEATGCGGRGWRTPRASVSTSWVNLITKTVRK